jgi:hypothetical protein
MCANPQLPPYGENKHFAAEGGDEPSGEKKTKVPGAQCGIGIMARIFFVHITDLFGVGKTGTGYVIPEFTGVFANQQPA